MTGNSDEMNDLYGTVKGPAHASDRAVVMEALRKVPVFVDVNDEELNWFIDRTHEFRFEAGEVMMHEGTPAKLMFVLLQGEIRGRKEKGGDAPVFTLARPVNCTPLRTAEVPVQLPKLYATS